MKLSRNGLRGCLVAAAAFASQAAAIAQVAMPPNLIPLPASNLSLVTTTTTTGTTNTLRFATTSWNAGTGPLRLEAGSVETGSNKQQVWQRVFNNDGSSSLFSAGWFEWHPTHNHFHFDGYANYTLQPVNAPGGSLRTGSKTTFCVMDTTAVNLSLPGAPSQASYAACGNVVQGMSVGWGDTYGAHLAGQEIDFTDNFDGVYQLKIEIDPNKVIVESNNNDNVSCALISIKKPSTVTVLDGSGSCSTVTSMMPKTALMGTTVPGVEIKGYGFSAGMTVTFENGNGPRPVASNVVVVDENTITATVTVPYKKSVGRDPLWDVRVGSGGLLRDAFTVTR